MLTSRDQGSSASEQKRHHSVSNHLITSVARVPSTGRAVPNPHPSYPNRANSTLCEGGCVFRVAPPPRPPLSSEAMSASSDGELQRIGTLRGREDLHPEIPRVRAGWVGAHRQGRWRGLIHPGSVSVSAPVPIGQSPALQGDSGLPGDRSRFQGAPSEAGAHPLH